MATAASAGFAGGFVASGGNLESGLRGAITASLFYGVGELTGHTPDFGSAEHIANIAGHAAVGCAMSNGDCGPGALAAGFGSFASPLVPTGWDFAGKVVAHAVIGGTASALGGGKFANGAYTAAFGYMFNAGMRKLTGAGHHKLTNQMASKYDWSDAALGVFDSLHADGGGRIPVKGHNFGDGHPQYNKDLGKFLDQDLKNLSKQGITPNNMTADQAKDLIRRIDADPKLRQFNVRVYMKGIVNSVKNLLPKSTD